MFNVPASQFTTQDTKTLWIEKNNTNDPQLKQLLSQQDTQLIDNELHFSQEQTTILHEAQADQFDCDDNDDSS